MEGGRGCQDFVWWGGERGRFYAGFVRSGWFGRGGGVDGVDWVSLFAGLSHAMLSLFRAVVV